MFWCPISVTQHDSCILFIICHFVQVNEVLSEVSLIKDRQEDLDGKLDTMKNENEALWREVGVLKTPRCFKDP